MELFDPNIGTFKKRPACAPRVGRRDRNQPSHHAADAGEDGTQRAARKDDRGKRRGGAHDARAIRRAQGTGASHAARARRPTAADHGTRERRAHAVVF